MSPRNLGMTAKEQRATELAARVVKLALDDLPNHPELCAGIMQSATLHLAIKRNQNASAVLATKRAAFDAFDALPWYRKVFAKEPA